MKDKVKRFLIIFFLVIASVYLFFHGMALAKGVLAPIFLAVILAMMLVPVTHWFEKKGVKEGWAVFFSDLVFVVLILGVLWAVGMELQKVASQWSSIQDRLSSQFSQIESFIEKNSGFSVENPFSQQESQSGSQAQNQQLQTGEGTGGESFQQGQQQQNKGGGNSGGMGFSVKDWFKTALSKIFSFLATVLLITIYIFFMLFYRKKFRKAVLKFVPEEHQEKAKKILSGIIYDARQYLVGNLILVVVLTIIYSIGFSFSGMKSPITTAFLASVLALVPYVGTALGGILAALIGYVTTGNMSAVWIVAATYAVAQFVESYLIEPFLVGKRVKVNPLFTIFAVTIGGAVWGVIGMIVFLPLFSFIKAIGDHVPMLNPIGYTIGIEDTSEAKEGGFGKKIKSWFK